MRKNRTQNPTRLSDVPDSIDKLLTRARFHGNNRKVIINKKFASDLDIFEMAAKAADRFDLVDRIEDARQENGEIRRVWNRLMNKHQYDTISYSELNILDPDLEKEDYDVMISNYFGSIDGNITVESSIQYIKSRRQYEHSHIVAKDFAERLNKPVKEVEKHLKGARKSSTIRHHFVNWGNRKNGKNALFFVNKSRTAMFQIYEHVLTRFEKERRRKETGEGEIPEGFIHIDDACDYGLTYSELVEAGRRDEIENKKKKRGRTTTFFFKEAAIQELIERKKTKPVKKKATEDKKTKKGKTTSTIPINNPPEETLFYCATTLSPREINTGHIPAEEMLSNAYFLTRTQISIFYHLGDAQLDAVIGSGKLKERTFVGTKRYRVANWLMDDLKRELKFEY